MTHNVVLAKPVYLCFYKKDSSVETKSPLPFGPVPCALCPKGGSSTLCCVSSAHCVMFKLGPIDMNQIALLFLNQNHRLAECGCADSDGVNSWCFIHAQIKFLCVSLKCANLLSERIVNHDGRVLFSR